MNLTRPVDPVHIGVRSSPARRGELAAGDWRFLLPRLRSHRILHLGAPPATLLPLLSGMSREVVIVSKESSALDGLRLSAVEHGIEHVFFVHADAARPLPFAGGRFDLVVSGTCPETSHLTATDTMLREFNRTLDASGVAYHETCTFAQLMRIRGFAKHGSGQACILWLARRKGALRLALPLGRRSVGVHCLEHIVVGVTRTGRVLRRIASVIARMGLHELVHPQRGVLLQRADASASRPVSSLFVLRAAREAGVPLSEAAVAFHAGADQNANKVTFLIFNGSAIPSVIVKMPRAPMYNGRLEHEHRMLSLLRERGAAAEGTYPEPLFLRHHNDLVLLGETVLHGRPFRHVTSSRADCEYARAAIEWITALGTRSPVERASAACIGRRLRELLTRFCELFPLTDREQAFLAERFAVLSDCNVSVPLVFRHGDATPWNIVVGMRGAVSFLDWEHAEQRSLPLWDLFAFMQGFALWAGRARGAHSDDGAFAAAFLESTPYNRLQREATSAYCDRVGIDRLLIEPLFYACWMQRAVRAPDPVRRPPENSPFFRVLRMAIRERSAAALACMLE